jgi:hypothetical protein
MVSEVVFNGKCVVLADHRFAAILGLLLVSLGESQDVPDSERTHWTKLWKEELANPVHGMRDLRLSEAIRSKTELH